MKIVESKPDLKERGFGSAVEMKRSEIRRAVVFQPIIEFALNEGKGNPIIKENGEELILIQIKSIGQFAFPVVGLGPSLVPFVCT